MSGPWAPRRFWTAAEAGPAEGGFAVHLDGRPVRTPAKRPLVVPSAALARAMADEWQAQDKLVRPETMPLTRAANSALDKVAPQRAAVIAELAGYGATDLLCYRAEAPAALAARQAAGWDPWLDWAVTDLGAGLRVTRGVVPVDQPAAALAALRAPLEAACDFSLAGLHDVVAISGSLVLALAVRAGRLTGDQAFALSRIDETFQIEQWGHDDEAEAAEAARRAGLLQAERFLSLLAAG
ncbi:MAG: ATPase [Rhodobacterales bacterium]|nr:ATPase [Rhodobacterales bacterium]